MLYTINPQSFNAVMACSAVKDVRYYLNSFFVDTDNNKLVATNGHVLATAPLERVEDGAEPDTHMGQKGFLFQRLQKPISNKGDKIYINCADRMLSYWNNRQWKDVDLELVDGRFPDYERVEYKGDTQPVAEVSFNAEYAAKPARWAGYDYAKAVFDFDGQLNSLGVRYAETDLTDVRLTLMPARL